MKVTTSDNSRERRHLISMITCPKSLAKFARGWTGEYFASKDANLIGGWCVDYYKKYGKAPVKRIESLLEKWGNGRDEEQVKSVSRLIQSLSDQFEKSEEGEGYAIDSAIEYFNEVALDRLASSLREALDNKRPDLADQIVSQYRRIEVSPANGVNFLHDDEALDEVFRKDLVKPVISYPGAMGNFTREPFRRGNFVVFAAGQKVGKTSFLVDTAYRAVSQRKRTVFIGLGDQTRQQVHSRFTVRICEHPLQSSNRDGSWPCEVMVPTHLVGPDPGKDNVNLSLSAQKFETRLDKTKAKKEFNEFVQMMVRSQKICLRTFVGPPKGLSAVGIDAMLADWATEEWTPDVIVVDYMDNIAPINPKKELRHQLAETWEYMRGLGIKYHCLVVSACQAKAGFQKERLMNRSFLGREGNAVLDSVTGVIGVNQTPEEKKKGLFRLNWPILRDFSFDEKLVCYVAGSLALGDPCMLSTF